MATMVQSAAPPNPVTAAASADVDEDVTGELDALGMTYRQYRDAPTCPEPVGTPPTVRVHWPTRVARPPLNAAALVLT